MVTGKTEYEHLMQVVRRRTSRSRRLRSSKQVYTGEKRVRINLRDTYFAASLHDLLAVRLAS
jgi:hypothetical protein